MSEMDCSLCCSQNNFVENCIWGVFINSVGIHNMQNKPEGETVEQWLCEIHTIDKKINQKQISTVVDIFKEKFRTTFIEMCRTHNARIMSQKIISVQGEKEFSTILREHMQDYINKYDKNADIGKLNHQVCFYLSRH